MNFKIITYITLRGRLPRPRLKVLLLSAIILLAATLPAASKTTPSTATLPFVAPSYVFSMTAGRTDSTANKRTDSRADSTKRASLLTPYDTTIIRGADKDSGEYKAMKEFWLRELLGSGVSKGAGVGVGKGIGAGFRAGGGLEGLDGRRSVFSDPRLYILGSDFTPSDSYAERPRGLSGVGVELPAAPRLLTPYESLLQRGATSQGGVMGSNETPAGRFYTYFRMNSSVVDLGYMNNRGEMNELYDLCLFLWESGRCIDSLVVTSAASPEGDVRRNEALALSRAVALGGYIEQRMPFVDARKVVLSARGEDWMGLLNLVRADDNVPLKEEVIGILEMSSDRKSREFFLRNLADGAPWRYIRSRILPLLRGGLSIEVFYTTATPQINTSEITASPLIPIQEEIAEDTLSITTAPTAPVFAPLITIERPALLDSTVSVGSAAGSSLESALGMSDSLMRPISIKPYGDAGVKGGYTGPLWALKTNLLYWAALQGNIEAEFYFGKQWSLNFEYQVAWWKNQSKHQYYQFMHCGPEGRYWFKGDNQFKGHFVGLHVGFGLYDLAWGNAPEYQGYQGEFAIALGLTYGYTWKVGERFYIEAGLGFGYIMTEYRRYRYIDECYVYQSTERMQFVGPTKARLTLQWRFDANGGSKKRGGAR